MTKPHLTLTDVAEILGVNRETARKYVHYYAWGRRKAVLRDPDSDPNAEFYDSNPMPAPQKPEGSTTMLWVPGPGETTDDIKQRLLAWNANRVGRGAGGGRKAEKSSEHRKVRRGQKR